jgi:hypothetical protein
MRIVDLPAAGLSRRAIEFHGDARRHGRYDISLWPSHHVPGTMHVSHTGEKIPVPAWFLAAWQAGEPVNGLLDYLLENDLAPPALAEAIRAAYAPA